MTTVRSEAVKAAARKRSREWYARNPEKAQASANKWRQENPDKVKAQKTEWMKIPENRVSHILGQAKRRALSSALDFDITIDDLLPLPAICPVLGVPINYQGTGARGFVNNSPSIDRIDSSKGYVKGNVQIISWRANRIKSDATLSELEQLVQYMRERSACK